MENYGISSIQMIVPSICYGSLVPKSKTMNIFFAFVVFSKV